MEHPNKPYKVEEVVAILDVSEDMVWRMCREGELPAVKAGRKWYIKRSEFDRKFGIAEAVPDRQPVGMKRGPKPRLSSRPIW